MPTYVITGANRGLGLEFVSQLSSQPLHSNTIIAGVRSLSDPSRISALQSLASSSSSSKIHIVECDTGSPSSISAFAKEVFKILDDGPEGKIDYLLNNAGINAAPKQTALTLTPEAVQEHMNVNVLGPALVVQALNSRLGNASVIMNMTSGLGSLGEAKASNVPKCTAYSISKAGLNMLTVHQAVEMRDRGVVVICMDPGWVKTDMGGEEATMEREDSIKGMLRILSGLRVEDSGKFYVSDGREKRW